MRRTGAAPTLAAAVAARLRPVCADWPADRFDALVADVVRFHERWVAWDARPGAAPRRRA